MVISTVHTDFREELSFSVRINKIRESDEKEKELDWLVRAADVHKYNTLLKR